MNNCNTESKLLKWIEVRTGLGMKYILIEKISYIKAQNKSSTIYFNDLSFIKTNHLLKWYSEKLFEPCFYRCHHSFIVNCMDIEYYCGDYIILKCCTRVPLSRNKKQRFKINIEALQNLLIVH